MDFKTLLSKMTLREKAAQMTQFTAQVLDPKNATDPTGPARSLGLSPEDPALCGSVFNITGAENRIRIQNEHLANDPNRIPLVFMQDVIHGFRTIYPIPLGMAASFEPDLMRRCAAMAAKEAAVSGIDVSFAPMVDISRDARWGRCMEGAGEDVLLGCAMAKAQVEGFREGMDGAHIEACVKHYAAYGAGEAGREYNYADMSEARLEDRYLPPYRAAVEAGASCVMPSFNSLNGVPSVANKHLMNEILKKRWGFEGLVVSDYGAVAELIAHGIAEDEADAARLALEAGCNFEMMSACFLHGLEACLAEGTVTMMQIDECVLHILEYKEKLGLFENPNGQADPEKESCCLSKAHRAIAREAAEKSAVLLKNDGLLPLSDKLEKIALIGPFASSGRIMGGWAVNGNAEDTVTIEQGLRTRLPNAQIRVCEGCGIGLREEQTGDPEAIRALAAWADAVILCVGEDGEQAGEAKSRTELSLPPAQLALAELVHTANPNTVTLLLTGRPLAIEGLDRIAHAILCLWQPGSEGGNAAAKLLFGDAVPGGHLPMTFPRTTGQEPISYDEYSTGRPALDRFDPQKNGFRSAWIDTPLSPLYPFGFGLSYTSFALTGASLSADTLTADGAIEARCTVENTGEREGPTLVQLYIRDCVGSVVRPVRELKGFEKLVLKPSEKREVCFTISEPMLRFTTLDKGYASEKGRFEAFLSFDSQTGTALPFSLI